MTYKMTPALQEYLAALIDAEDGRQLLEERITAAMANPDPAIQAKWAACPREGERPAPEEFLCWIMGQALDDLRTEGRENSHES